MTKIFSFNSELYKITGVQKVLMDIHHALRDDYPCRIVGTKKYASIHPELHIPKVEYIRWTNPFMFHNSIVFVHERKFLLLFWILNFFFRQSIKIVYVHHNIFHDHIRTTVMPKYVVSISDRSTQNLAEVFRVPLKNIYKIYNCVVDIKPQPHKIHRKGDSVTLLYPARINDVKQQLTIVKMLSGNLDKRIKIKFVGTGQYLNQLKEQTANSTNFEALGFRSDVCSLLQECDFMMLFSIKEGLPITLIEAAMCGTPIVCNDVGGNTEIAKDGENAFVRNDWNTLIETINSLPDMNENTYNCLSQNSRKIYKNSFTFEHFKRSYKVLIEQIESESDKR